MCISSPFSRSARAACISARHALRAVMHARALRENGDDMKGPDASVSCFNIYAQSLDFFVSGDILFFNPCF